MEKGQIDNPYISVKTGAIVGRVLGTIVILLIISAPFQTVFVQPVSAVRSGESRSYDTVFRTSRFSREIYSSSSESMSPSVETDASGSIEVEFQKFVDLAPFDIPIPSYYMTRGDSMVTIIPTKTVYNYNDALAFMCVGLSANLILPYWVGDTQDECVRQNLYSSIITPLYHPSDFPDNSELVRAVSQDNVHTGGSIVLSLPDMAAIFGDYVFADSDPYTYNYEFSLSKSLQTIGFSLRTWLDVNRTELISELLSLSTRPTVYGKLETTKEIRYSRQSGWMLTYAFSVEYELITGVGGTSNVPPLMSDQDNITVKVVNTSNSLFDIAPIPSTLVLIALLPIALFLWQRRKRRRAGKQELYPRD